MATFEHIPFPSLGMTARMMDIERGPLFDITSPEGFLLALCGTLHIRHNGLLRVGVPCNNRAPKLLKRELCGLNMLLK